MAIEYENLPLELVNISSLGSLLNIISIPINPLLDGGHEENQSVRMVASLLNHLQWDRGAGRVERLDRARGQLM